MRWVVLVLLAEASVVEWYALFVVEAKQAHAGTTGQRR